MKSYQLVLSFFAISVIISSCKFSCKAGKLEEPGAETKAKGPRKIGETLVYNDIEITSKDVKLSKAYLVFENGDRVPEGNFVDFTAPVKMLLIIDSGWTKRNSRIMLGASEKITSESGITLLNERDLFADNPEGVSEEDAKIIGLTASIEIKPGSPPTSFKVYFKVWDKNSDAYIEGGYKLFSK